MAKLPTPEEMGVAFLEEVSYFKHRPDESVNSKGIYMRLIKRGFRGEDIQSGADYLVEQGHLEGDNLILTASGFEAMP